MRFGGSKIKLWRISPAIGCLLAIALAGCAMAPHRPVDAAPAQPLAQLDLPSGGADEQAMTQAMAGEFALVDGNLPAASAAYAQAAALSSDPRVAERAAQLALAHGDRQGAAQSIARMQATGASAAALDREHARLALMKGHRDEAAADLKRILAKGDRDAWREFAKLLDGARDPALAGALLESLATPQTLPASDASVWVAISQLGVKLERHMYAARIADAAAAKFNDAQACAWAAHLKFDSGDKAGGKALFERALKAAPKDVRLRLVYAAALGQIGENGAAAAMLATGPQTLDVYTARAAYLLHAGDKPALARVYAELERAAPKLDENASYLLGQLADMRGDAKAALGWYAKVPAGDEHAFDATARRAVLLQQQGNAGEAHALAAQLQQDDGDDDEQLRRALLLDAQLYVGAGDQTAAVAAYSRALQQLPDDPELLYGRALSQADSGHSDAAITDLRRVLQLKPDDVDAMNALGYTLADVNRDLGEAERLLKRALAAKPDEPAVIDSWGWLQYRLGHLDQAEQSLRRAWGAQKDPDIGVHLGEVLWKQGKHDEADRVFAAVRKADPRSTALHEAMQRLQR